MEQVLGLHPRRRTELVQQRLQVLAANQARLQASLDAEQARQHDLFDALQTACQDETRGQAEVEQLSAKQLVRQANHALDEALTEVKTLVQDVAHCRARLVHNALGRVLIFDEHSPYAGSLLLLSGQIAFQHVLPFFKSLSFLPPETS
jgi:hypothetical protein